MQRREKMEDTLKTIGNWLITEGVKVLIALVVMLIAFIVINIICGKWCNRLLKRGKGDKTILSFTFTVLKIVLKVLVFVAMVGYLGVQTSSISAAIASVGLAIGLALQGSLSNLAGSFVLVITHPFKVGDYIECEGVAGTVEKIELFHTFITTSQNQVIAIPNGKAANSVIKNFSTNKTRRMDAVLQVELDTDLDKAKNVILDCLLQNKNTLKNPAPFVGVTAHTQNAIEITIKTWTNGDIFWDYNSEILQCLKKTFDENGIKVPHSQMDVYMKDPKSK